MAVATKSQETTLLPVALFTAQIIWSAFNPSVYKNWGSAFSHKEEPQSVSFRSSKTWCSQHHVEPTGCPQSSKGVRTLGRLFFPAPYRTLLCRSFLRGRFSFENRAGNVGDTTGEIAENYHYPYYHHRQNHIGHSFVSSPLFTTQIYLNDFSLFLYH